MPPISSDLNMWTRRLLKTVQITGRVRSRKPPWLLAVPARSKDPAMAPLLVS